MKYHVGTAAPVPQRGLIVEIAAHEPNLWSPAQLLHQRGAPDQGRNGITTRTKRPDQVSTDEAGATGHKDVHSGLS